MEKLSGSLFVITGGASGIGLLTARGLAAKGCRVVVWDVNGSALARVEQEAQADGLDIRGMQCDVSDREAVYRAAEEVRTRWGEVDGLINNAGVVSGQSFLETSDEKVERTMKINTLANFWTVRAFLPGMIERNRGRIVTVASAAGIIGVTGLADYSASKFAAFGFHEAIRMELRKRRSRVATTVVCPFFINTGMFDGVKTRFPLLLPIMKPEAVASRIVTAIERGTRRVILPPFVYSVYLLRLLPVAVMDAVADFFGISAAMDEFRGRKTVVQTVSIDNGPEDSDKVLKDA